MFQRDAFVDDTDVSLFEFYSGNGSGDLLAENVRFGSVIRCSGVIRL